MRVLYLGPERDRVAAVLAAHDEVRHCEDRLAADSAVLRGVDWIVSYGYRYILKPAVLDRFEGRAVNLHISYLPHNRGADPNLWSILDDTPKGVTIHQLDAGVDTGDVIAHRLVEIYEDDTLATSYARLGETIEALFEEVWEPLRAGLLAATKQPPGGSVHRKKDRAAVEHLLSEGWQTPVRALLGRHRTFSPTRASIGGPPRGTCE